MLAGIFVFGSVWGLLECVLGGARVGVGAMERLPMGAVLTGTVALALMVSTRRLYGTPGMQVGMALVAGLLRFWAPVGSYVICSALAIVAEGVVFEAIMLSPSLALSRLRTPALSYLGIVTGFTIYLIGYTFTQMTTPIAAGEAPVLADVASVIPLGLGRGLLAALTGALVLPLAAHVDALHIDLGRVRREHYYPFTASVTAVCWIAFAVLFW